MKPIGPWAGIAQVKALQGLQAGNAVATGDEVITPVGAFQVRLDGDKLGTELIRMNYRALAARYGDDVPSDVLYRYRREDYMKHNRLKAMCCLRYQCSEGDVPDCDLYQRLTDAIHSLAYIIATSTQEYNDAPWDVPSGTHTVEQI